MSSGPSESQLLYGLGNSLLDHLAATTTECLFYGIFLLLFSISTATLLRRRTFSTSVWVMFMATVICFIIATMGLAADIAGFAILIRAALVDNIDIPMSEKREQTNLELFKPSMISLWCSTIPPIISDITAIWRASVLFPERRWILIGPVSLWLGTIATTFAYLALVLKFAGGSAAADIPENLIDGMFGASAVLSLATNTTATLLIAFTLWVHRKSVVNYLGPGSRQSAVRRVLILLIESGATYCVFQLVFLILFFVPPTDTALSIWIAIQVFNSAYPAISLIYPTTVVVLVNTRRSFIDPLSSVSRGGEVDAPDAERVSSIKYLDGDVATDGEHVSEKHATTAPF